MESTQQCDHETYRAIVLGQGGTELLLKPTDNGFLLPSVEIPRWQRLAENMTLCIRNEWGQETICLFNPDVSALVTSANDHMYQVMECYGPGKSHPRAEWVQVSSLSERTFVDPRDEVAVQQSLAECARGFSTAAPGPFARLGWFRELRAWIEEVIGSQGFHLTENFAQLNASPSFSLVRFETSGPAVWFKAVGNPNLREFPITLELARFFPQYLPPILAAQPEWNGWLALEVEGANLSDTRDARHWKTAALALAKLQIESTDRIGTLFASGARDLRASALLKLVRPFLDAMGQLMEKQTKTPPPVLPRSELTWLGEQIEEALSSSADLGIPDTLGHLDLNSGNVIVSEGQCVFLDWAEAYVGTPFLSFQYLVEHSRRVAGADFAAESGLTRAYAEEWQSFVSTESLQGALALAPMLAVFSYAASTDAWGDQATLQDPKVAGYLRSLTRRLHREGKLLRDRGTLCPN
jgi:hypothetical protein